MAKRPDRSKQANLVKQKPLNEQERVFVEEYLTNGFKAREAFMKSHPDKVGQSRSLDQIGKKANKWFKSNLNVQWALREAEKKAMTRVTKAMSKYAISKERIAEELAKIAFTNATDVVSFTNGGVDVKNSADLTDEEKASIAEVTEFRSEKTGTVVKIKQHDKIQALTALGKSMGMFTEQVKHEHEHKHVTFVIQKD